MAATRGFHPSFHYSLLLQATARQKELLRQHRCTPAATIAIPIVSQLPLFLGTSAALSHAARTAPGLESEAFLSLTSLASADPTATLPIALGLLTFINVESSRWFASAEALQREQAATERTAARRAAGELVLEPHKITQSALRGMSVARILIASLWPGVSLSRYHAITVQGTER